MIWERNHLLFRKSRKSRGQGMLEFALALPIFLMLVLGVIEFGRLLAVVSSVTTAAREGARYGSAAGVVSGDTAYYQDCQGMRDAAKRVGFFAGIQDSNVQIGYFDADSRADVPDPTGYVSTKQCSGSTSTYLYDPNLSPRVVVKASVQFKFLFFGFPPFPISSESARTIVTQIEMDVTPGTITPAPPKTATATVTGTVPTPTNTSSPTDTATPTLEPTATFTVTGTLPTPTATSSETPTPTATLTATPLPPCGFVSVGAGIKSNDANYGFAVYNASGGGNQYPAQDIWVRSINIAWHASNGNKTVNLTKINYTGVAVYTAGGAGDPEPSKSVGFSNGEGPRVGATSNGQIGFVFNVENGTSTVIDRASVVIQYQDANGYHDCPLNPYVPNPLVQ